MSSLIIKNKIIIILITLQKLKAAFLSYSNNVSSEDKEDVKTAETTESRINNSRLNEKHVNLNSTVKMRATEDEIDNSKSDEKHHKNLSNTIKMKIIRDKINNNKSDKRCYENLSRKKYKIQF